MAGLTPFQFSSRRQQELTMGSAFGISIGGNIGQLLKSSFSWYEMWINPEKVDIATTYKQKRQHTAGSIVTYHYRRDVLTMSVSGHCGWVMIESKNKKGVSARVKGPSGEELLMDALVYTGSSRKPWNIERNAPDEPRSPTQTGLKSDNTDNSPRVFLKRLKSIADEPMYFVDLKGIEHYNTKFIKIYTKQFPDGVICEGYYTRFTVPESAEDVQTIAYNFEFMVENLTPISFLEKKLGMWGGFGKVKKATNVVRGLS